MSPPRIMFDDGSRIMQDDGESEQKHAIPTASGCGPDDGPSTTSSSSARDGTVSLESYYEIDRVAREAVDKLDWSERTSRGRLLRRIIISAGAAGQNDTSNNDDDVVDHDSKRVVVAAAAERGQEGRGRTSPDEEDDGFLCRVALQFPDELLSDAPDVSWLMEGAIANAYGGKLLVGTTSHPPSRPNDVDGRGETSSSTADDDENRRLIRHHLARTPLLFVLGDTTYGSCCPDEVSANHLNADLIVHFGYACLAPTESVPVVYAFGVSGVVGCCGGAGDGDDGRSGETWKECVRLASEEARRQITKGGGQQLEGALDRMSMEQGEKHTVKLLILYEVMYHHAMDELKLEFDKMGEFQVVVGAIPKQQLSARTLAVMNKTGGCGSGAECDGGGCSSESKQTVPSSNTCCAPNEDGGSTGGARSTESCSAEDTPSSCCASAQDGATCELPDTEPKEGKSATGKQPRVEKQYIPRTIGGLEIPDGLDLSQHTLLYVGDDLNIDSHDGNARTRLLHILLRCGAPDGPHSIWSYSPANRRLIADVLDSPLSPTDTNTTLSTVLSRTLRRRYFLINKAKLATTIAILIGTTSNSYSFRRLLSRTRHRIQSTGRTAYTFAVGKLATSAHKLSNFAEIDCFVLIACGESVAKFWRMEREEMLVPVLTPLELDVALGFREWDGRYSCDFGDLIRWDEADGVVEDEDGFHGGDDACDDGSNLPRAKKQSGKDDGDDGSNGNSDDDEPFFSMISGKYEQSRTIANASKQNMHSTNLEALPGQGKLIEYRSEAAEFLKQREYTGLKANVGETEVKAAVLGQVGIASNYGEKL